MLKLTRRAGFECELVGRFNHPHICQIYSVRDDDPSGLTAISMPYLGERTLQDVINDAWSASPAQQHLSGESNSPAGRSVEYVDRIIHMALDLCTALETAHEREVLHCDLKPSNVLIREDGSAVLLDFNLAFSLEEGRTVLGGTVGFMAPEQVTAILNRQQPSRVDRRTDVFGLGAVLYHALTDEVPWLPETTDEQVDRLLAQLTTLHEQPPRPVHEINPAVCEPISRLIARCLDPDPHLRPQSITEVRLALASFATSRQHVETPSAKTAWRHSNHLVAGVGVAALMLVAGLLAGSWQSGTRVEQSVADSATTPAISPGAQAEFRRLASLPLAQLTSEEQARLAYWHCLAGNWHSAREIYQNLSKSPGQSAALHNNLGYCLLRLGEIGSAREQFLLAIAADPTLDKAWANLVEADTRCALVDGRPPESAYQHEAERFSDDRELLSALDAFVRLAEDQHTNGRHRPEHTFQFNSLAETLQQIEPNRRLISLTSLP